MFVLFTPYTFLYLVVYMLLLGFLIFISSFYTFWILIEVLILVYIGVRYTVFTNSFTSLMVYFLFQRFASFRVFLFYT